MAIKTVSLNVHGHRIDLAAYGEKFIGDDDYLAFGDGEDITAKWDGTNLEILPATDNTGAINIGDGTTSMDVQVFGFNANNYILWDNSAGRLTVQRTYAAAEDIATYEYGMYLGMSLGTAAASGKYIAGLKIAMEGEANYDAGAAVWPLWVDIQNVGTNSASLFGIMRLSVQSGACLPNHYIYFQSASPGVEHLYKIANIFAPVHAASSGALSGTIKKIAIQLSNDTFYIPVATVVA